MSSCETNDVLQLAAVELLDLGGGCHEERSRAMDVRFISKMVHMAGLEVSAGDVWPGGAEGVEGAVCVWHSL